MNQLTTNYEPLKEYCRIQKAEPYSCKFESECKKEGTFHPETYKCRHGGGISCRTWKRKTNQEIGPRKLGEA